VATIVNDDDLVGNIVDAQLDVQMLHGRCNALGLVSRRDYHGQLVELRKRGIGLPLSGHELPA
jgi:hypothetical protein